MKEQHWDDSTDETSKDILEGAVALMDDNDEDEVLERSTVSSNKLKVTEMRRRIEERLDSKRISLQFDYEELENWTDTLNDNWTDSLQ
ncbi:MAG: putative ATPase [Pseudohongiellaceae bacterium]|jgi:predicted ATPase